MNTSGKFLTKSIFVLSILFLFGLSAFAQETEELVTMSLEDLLNMEVIVASKSAEKLSDAPGIISVISKDELERFGGTTLKDVLERVPGLSIGTVPYSNRTVLVARGDFVKQNSSHILILINGRPVREIQEGGNNAEVLNTFPVNIVERIEVIKGPGSVLYGSDAFSGVVNIITVKAEKNSVAVSGLGAFSEDNTGYGAIGGTTFKVKGADVVFGARYLEKPTWKAPLNTVVYDAMFTPIGDTTLTLDIPDKGYGVFLDVNYKNLRVMSTYNEWNTLGTQVYNDVKNSKLFSNLGYSYNVSDKWNMDFNVTFAHTELDGDLLSKRSSYNLVGEWTNFITLSDKSKLALGVSFDKRDGKEDNQQVPDSVVTISEGDQTGYTGYAQLDYWVLDNLKGIIGLQANKVGDLDLSVLPRGGLIYYPIDRVSVKALYSQAYRAPSINELYMNFDIGLFGDENLEPEKVSTFDFGVNYQGEQIQLGVSYFYSEQTDIIQPVYTDFPASWNRTYMNLSDVTFKGYEFEGKYYFNRNLFLTGSALYQEHKQKEVENPVAKFSEKGGISYMWDKGVTVSLFDIYQDKLKDEFNGVLNPNPGKTNIVQFHSNFKLNQILNFDSKIKVDLFVNVDNLLDEEVYMWDWGGYSFDTIPAVQGRVIYAGLSAQL